MDRLTAALRACQALCATFFLNKFSGDVFRTHSQTTPAFPSGPAAHMLQEFVNGLQLFWRQTSTPSLATAKMRAPLLIIGALMSLPPSLPRHTSFSTFSEEVERAENQKIHREMEGIARFERMVDAQRKETTETMQKYTHETHHLKIEEEGHGYLGVSIKTKGTHQIEHFVLVPKHRHGTGTTYIYRDPLRLQELQAEPSQLMPGHVELKGKSIPEWLAVRERLGIFPPEGQTPDQRRRSRLRR